MARLNKSHVDHYREQLRKIKDRLRAVTSSVVEQSREASGGQGGGELSNAPLHLGDTGTEEFLYDMNTTLMENEQFLLKETIAAEQRLAAGTYGKCEGCAKSIPRERLDVIPYTRYCVGCAEQYQNRPPDISVDAGRPQGPRDTIAPEGEMQENRSLEETTFSDESAQRTRTGDVYAAGTAGGGTAIGGLAGTNIGHGDPTVHDLQNATGSGTHDADEARGDNRTPKSGRSGGAVGGTPARKRST